MKCQMMVSASLLALVAGAGDSAPIVRVGLYKNGLAVVTRTVSPDSTGTAVVDGSARPAYGTFWHSADRPVTVTRTAARDNVMVWFRAAPDFAPVLAGPRRTGTSRRRPTRSARKTASMRCPVRWSRVTTSSSCVSGAVRVSPFRGI